MAIDEQAKRKPTWRDGEGITLADGQVWSFRKPLFRFVPTVAESGEMVLAGGRRTLGPDFDALLNKIVEDEGGTVQFDTALNLALCMLSPNYDLSLADLQELLPCIPGDDDNAAMWQLIVDVALGSSPKAMASGSEAS